MTEEICLEALKKLNYIGSYAESPNGLADSLTNEWLDKNGLIP